MNNHPTLYHGTDARIVSMTEEERKSRKDLCKEVATQMWSYFEPHFENMHTLKAPLKFEEDQILWLNLYNALVSYKAKINGNEQYQYGDDCLYVTNWDEMAKRYAGRSFAFGEIGLIAYRMIEAHKMIIGRENWKETLGATEIMKQFLDFADAKEEPVIFEIKDYDIDYLRLEDNRELDELGFRANRAFRYNKHIDLDLANAIYL